MLVNQSLSAKIAPPCFVSPFDLYANIPNPLSNFVAPCSPIIHINFPQNRTQRVRENIISVVTMTISLTV